MFRLFDNAESFLLLPRKDEIVIASFYKTRRDGTQRNV